VAAAEPVPQLVQFLQQDPDILRHGQKEVVIGRAPARLDVMGGTSDISGGLVCTFPLQAAAAVAVQRRDDRNLVIKTYNASAAPDAQPRVELSLDDFYGTAALLPNSTLRDLFTGGRHWAAYIAGVFPTLARHRKITRRTRGANIACFSNVPFGVGLGSSAAVVCATLSALASAFQMLLEPLEMAVLTQKLEHQIVGVPRGIMDPAVAILGKANHLLVMKCQPHEVKAQLPVPPDLMLAAINTGVAPPIGAPAYQNARLSAALAQLLIARAYQDFGTRKDPAAGYLANVPLDMFERYFRTWLPESITGQDFIAAFGPLTGRGVEVDPHTTYRPRAAAAFHLLENARTGAFIEKFHALQAPAPVEHRHALASAAGRFMLESHTAATNLLHLGSPALDAVVQAVQAKGPSHGLFGARAMGVGSGGSVAVLAADTDQARQALADIAAHCPAGSVVLGSSGGAAEVPPIKWPIAAMSPRPTTAAG
jgi:galactokinase